MSDTAFQNDIFRKIDRSRLRTVAQPDAGVDLCIDDADCKPYIVKREDRSALGKYRALQDIDNPHLARVVDVLTYSDYIEVITEYIAGDTLSDILDRCGTLPRNDAIRIAAEICDGLWDLHTGGFVHRDINPNNIIITKGGHAVIIDYGITRAFDMSKNCDTVILGTPGYAAPEQFGFTQSDVRTDLYAVGVLLNVMLTGCLPNEARPKGAIGAVVRKCVEIDYRKRYRSVKALGNALKSLIVYDGPADKFIRRIPGLRSNHIIVVILASLGYFLGCFLSFFVLYAPPNGKWFQNFLAWILFIPFPFACFTNFLGLWDKVPFTKGSTKRSQRILYTILGVLSVFSALIWFAKLNASP